MRVALAWSLSLPINAFLFGAVTGRTWLVGVSAVIIVAAFGLLTIGSDEDLEHYDL